MRVSRFFRRRSRTLLMVFMSLLLVVFLIGDQLQNWASKHGQQDVTVGRAFGRDITTADTRVMESKRFLLGQLGFGLAGWIEPLELYLLTTEARNMGIHVGHDQVKLRLAQQFGAAERADARLAAIQQRTGQSYATIFDIVGEWLAVEQLVELQSSAAGESVSRAELDYRNQSQEADAELSVIDSEALLPFVPEPTPDELQAFYDEAKDRRTNHTEDALEFGYQLPDRVRIEYLTVDPAVVESKVRIRPREVKEYFESHHADYMKTVRSPASQSAEQPSPERVPMTFEEAETQARSDARREKATHEAQSLVNKIRRAAHQPWQLTARDNDGFRLPPPAAEIESFEELRSKFSDTYEVTYGTTELVGKEAISELFSPKALPTLVRQRLGAEPEYTEGQASVTLSDLALRVQGLFTPEREDRLPVLSLLEPSPVMVRQINRLGERVPGQSYVFRVVEVAPKGPPASLDDVRRTVVADYKLLKAHEMAGEYARKLADAARQSGLAAAVEGATELKERLAASDETMQPQLPPEPGVSRPAASDYVKSLGPVEPSTPLTRDTTMISEVGETETVPREVFALASDTGSAHKVAVADVAYLYRWVVVELEGIKPIYAGEFEQKRVDLLRRGRAIDRQVLAIGWLAKDNVHRRAGFTRPAGWDDSSEVEP